MVLRRLFLRWLFPAAFLLPLWLFVGWIVFGGGSGWALLWLLIAAPAVFVTQILVALIVRGRGSVRLERSASWRDVVGVGLWQVVVIALGLYDSRTFFPLLVLSVVGAFVLLWSSLAQMWNEARAGVALLHTSDGTGYIPPTQERPRPQAAGEVIVISEKSASS
ncbi:MAG: MFS transporter permease [Microbacterium sp. SCN 71-17]|uniref:MFS transporter permease n=1 Tax=Microbacterium sp. SCN 71-17 TaxID=1660111 RepID=UPI000869CE09|nr:MFS transporter permease [Microbacterium sp. SCN 71-17]ODT38804.1 MAG: MFS transporter permease [Microbacterium sp. SCN 71-17]